ncbi:MAG: hypothetical protein A4E67_00668 [Syntrophaceae bacterium PtaB.Bin038]|nr:MAG: hypothetical protein A4E67_00668 [Syntrophaceae bacterium PtaB.Bin038]
MGVVSLGIRYSSAFSMSGGSCCSSPKRPISRDRTAFWRDSLKVRPMAMVSPTDFMDVVRRSSVSGNFSKVHRGIFVTT